MMEKMISKMMPMYHLFAWMGLVIVLVAFWFALQGAGANAAFFSADKATREAAGTGSVLAVANVVRHSVPAWVPSFKFLGLGVMLGAIVMALGMIATTLRKLGQHVMDIWPEHLNPGVPKKPRSAKMFPMVMMMGWMVLIIGFIWALVLNGTVVDYWNHAVATELNPAGAGSAMLAQLGVITSTLPWLGAIRITGMALLFTAITVALTVIIRTLQTQEQILTSYVKSMAGSGD